MLPPAHAAFDVVSVVESPDREGWEVEIHFWNDIDRVIFLRKRFAGWTQTPKVGDVILLWFRGFSMEYISGAAIGEYVYFYKTDEQMDIIDWCRTNNDRVGVEREN